jgi:hypothetical protein
VSLLGASEGAKTSIVEGATLRPPVQSVVSLSAEEALQGVAVAAVRRQAAGAQPCS